MKSLIAGGHSDVSGLLIFDLTSLHLTTVFELVKEYLVVFFRSEASGNCLYSSVFLVYVTEQYIYLMHLLPYDFRSFTMIHF